MAEPLIPPVVGLRENPVHRICINAEWWSHVSGKISDLTYLEQWEGTATEKYDATQVIYDLLDVGLPVDDCEDIVTIQYPQHATCFHDESTILVGGALVRSSLASAPYNVVDSFYNTITYQGSAANGDSFGQPILLDAGNYTFYSLGALNSSHGKVDWYMDSDVTPFISGHDWYNATLVKNTIKSGSVTISTAGLHFVKAVMNGRNASNTLAYALPLTKYWFTKV